MAALQTPPLTTSRLVEISGWDENASFFVERPVLATDDSTATYVSLSRMLAKRAVVFLRLFQPTSPQRTQPKVYEAEFLARDCDGHYRFRLDLVRPRHRCDRQPPN